MKIQVLLGKMTEAINFCTLLTVKCFLSGHLQCALCFLFLAFASCLSLCALFPFLLSEIKVNELRRDKKYVTRNIIISKTVYKKAKRAKSRNRKKHIVDLGFSCSRYQCLQYFIVTMYF